MNQSKDIYFSQFQPCLIEIAQFVGLIFKFQEVHIEIISYLQL